MTERELLQMALDALEDVADDAEESHKTVSAIKALRARLAQPEPWVKTYSGGKPNYTEPCERCGEVNPAEIHTCTPKQREWVGLTGEELQEIYQGAGTVHFKFAMVEAKLKEKNT